MQRKRVLLHPLPQRQRQQVARMQRTVPGAAAGTAVVGVAVEAVGAVVVAAAIPAPPIPLALVLAVPAPVVAAAGAEAEAVGAATAAVAPALALVHLLTLGHDLLLAPALGPGPTLALPPHHPPDRHGRGHGRAALVATS